MRLILLLVLMATTAGATCNVIPSTDRLFPSERGLVSRPFARPGDVVVVRNVAPVFAREAAANTVMLTFLPPGLEDVIEVGPVAVLPRQGDAACSDADCDGDRCRCLRFAFPDTDDRVAASTDRLTLTGPVEITVRTGGQVTARIGRLTIGDTGFGDELFPHFVALPPANRFANLLAGPGADVRAAEDTAGNLFIPLDFDTIIPMDERRTRFLEAVIPNLGVGGSVQIDVFTTAGQRLPPLVRQVEPRGDSLLGTADTRESVFRIAKGALRPALIALDGGGPTIVPNVMGFAEASKQADPETMLVGERFAVYEARECDPAQVDTCGPGQPAQVRPCGSTQTTGSSCIDLNCDGDGTDYFLYAIDLTAPRSAPFVVDTIDACGFSGYPASFPPFGLYAFNASDALVAFRIVEGGIDMNGNGRADDLLRSGAFDLGRRARVAAADGSPRQEVHASLLAWSQPADPPGTGDVLYWYDAGATGGQVRPVSDATHAHYFVTRHPVGAADRGRRVHPFDLAVAGGRIAFVVPEALQAEDLTGNGTATDAALLVFDAAAQTVANPKVAMTPDVAGQTLALTQRWLAAQSERSAPTRKVVAVRDLDQPTAPTRFLCDQPGGDGILAPSISDAVVPCLRGGVPGDLRVLLGDGTQQDVPLRIASPLDVQVAGDVLVVGIDETIQGTDLDGDGQTTPGFVLHTFHARRRGTPTNFRRRLIRSNPPYLQFLTRGLVVLSPSAAGPVRTIFRDVDADGVFEEPIPEPGTPSPRIADNCPTIENPTQPDGDGDGVGDACECPVLRVETVRAFAGSRVEVPVDFEPGRSLIAATNFDLDYRPGLATLDWDGCRHGPILRTARATLTCVERTPGLVTSLAINPETMNIPSFGAGELAAYELSVAARTDGTSIPVCVDPSTIRYSAPDGFDVTCPPPRHCGEVRVDPFCKVQGDCNCDDVVNGGDRVCLVSKFFDPSLRGKCPSPDDRPSHCEDCNLSGRLNAADAPCITRCSFGDCVTMRR